MIAVPAVPYAPTIAPAPNVDGQLLAAMAAALLLAVVAVTVRMWRRGNREFDRIIREAAANPQDVPAGPPAFIADHLPCIPDDERQPARPSGGVR